MVVSNCAFLCSIFFSICTNAKRTCTMGEVTGTSPVCEQHLHLRELAGQDAASAGSSAGS